MKISIITAYYNRRRQFLNTLKVLEAHPKKDQFNIVVVDDASDEEHRLEDLDLDLDLELIRFEREDKTWVNPCIPFNVGLTYAEKSNTDIVIIQNPECLHFGDIIGEVLKIKKGEYLNFGCYSVNELTQKKINRLDLTSPNRLNLLGGVLYPLNNRSVIRDGENGFYNHSVHRPHQLHFCSAMMTQDLVFFDEDFKDGIGYDDNDFLLSVKRGGLTIKMIDKPFVIHQYHGVSDYSNRNLVKRNYDLYMEKLKGFPIT